MPLARFPAALLAFRAYDYLAEIPPDALVVMWKPDAVEFRQSTQFDMVVRVGGVLEYWQARGFPPHCRPVGADGFQCD